MVKSMVTMERVVRDLAGELVGCIEPPPAGPFRVKLEGRRGNIAEAINVDIQQGIPLPTPEHKSQAITGSTEAELAAIVHTIRVLSERQLYVTQETVTAHKE